MGELSKAVIGKNILDLVREKPEVKKNRNLLVTEYWKKFQHATTLEDASICTSAESITRRFRNLVSDGSIRLDEESKQVLSAKQDEFRNDYSEIPSLFIEIDVK